MEKDTTQRKIKTIPITIFGRGLKERLNGTLTGFINPDGKDMREFFFSVAEIETGLRDEDKNAKMFIIANGKQDVALGNLLRQIEKTGRPYITISGEKEGFTERAKAMLAELEKLLDMGFTLADFAQVYPLGIPAENLRRQLLIFRHGVRKTELKRPAHLNDGIFAMPAADAEKYAQLFESKKDAFRLTKFVPASGAASRMFQFLCEFLIDFNPENDTINAYINRRNKPQLSMFLVGMDKFPFFSEVTAALKQHPAYGEWDRNTRAYNFIKALLEDKRFDFANKPKGILPFHQYDGFTATPVYEHLKEAVAYAESQKQAYVHFTISEDHLDGFLDAIKEVKGTIEEESGINLNIDFSYQKKHTDTIAVDMNNAPFRETDSKLLFRPGGHGALIENLGQLDADIVFIKNIDNVSHNNIHTIALYKKALAGMLIELQQQVFAYLEKISSDSSIDEALITEIFTFAKEKLSQYIPDDVNKYTLPHKAQYALELLDRPMRICGMVKNEGEPGGGPFWVACDKGGISLQIVESSQIDHEDRQQQKILSDATHFNPVDIVCGLKNYKGESFNLHDYIDTATGFITYKNRKGRDVKSYELPGLWNGAMAKWITVFVEVPLDTFNPVKTVNDLLKPAHQPQ